MLYKAGEDIKKGQAVYDENGKIYKVPAQPLKGDIDIFDNHKCMFNGKRWVRLRWWNK